MFVHFYDNSWHNRDINHLCPYIVFNKVKCDDCRVNHYGPTKCLRECVFQQWSEGVRLCLSEGAEVGGDCIGLAVRHAGIFRQLTELVPKTNIAHWREFQLQRGLRRVPDVLLVEEFFWINGFKDN